MKTLYDWLNACEPRGLGIDLDDDDVMRIIANHVVVPDYLLPPTRYRCPHCETELGLSQ